jgi:hypothetical protein
LATFSAVLSPVRHADPRRALLRGILCNVPHQSPVAPPLGN